MPDDTAARVNHIRDINARVRAIIERETVGKPFWVGGLVCRYHISDFGHVYFDLYHGNHSIACMIPESARGGLGFTVANGMEIEVFGTLRVYEPRAKIEIEVESARLIERGAYANYIDIEEQLRRKGLWPRRKRPLPEQITRIGLITSKQSDALHDFEDTYRRESAGNVAAIQLVDVRVQGEQAPREIADAINRLNQEAEVDVIVLVRGGGRAAELATFDDYLIAEAICRSDIPVVTGIGHQRDETFADRVADVAAITPTDAALRLAKGTGELVRISPLEEQVADAGRLFNQAVPAGTRTTQSPDWLIFVVAAIGIAILTGIFLLLLLR